jgi:hypothetical protein
MPTASAVDCMYGVGSLRHQHVRVTKRPVLLLLMLLLPLPLLRCISTPTRCLYRNVLLGCEGVRVSVIGVCVVGVRGSSRTVDHCSIASLSHDAYCCCVLALAHHAQQQ